MGSTLQPPLALLTTLHTIGSINQPPTETGRISLSSKQSSKPCTPALPCVHYPANSAYGCRGSPSFAFLEASLRAELVSVGFEW